MRTLQAAFCSIALIVINLFGSSAFSRDFILVCIGPDPFLINRTTLRHWTPNTAEGTSKLLIPLMYGDLKLSNSESKIIPAPIGSGPYEPTIYVTGTILKLEPRIANKPKLVFTFSIHQSIADAKFAAGECDAKIDNLDGKLTAELHSRVLAPVDFSRTLRIDQLRLAE